VAARLTPPPHPLPSPRRPNSGAVCFLGVAIPAGIPFSRTTAAKAIFTRSPRSNPMPLATLSAFATSSRETLTRTCVVMLVCAHLGGLPQAADGVLLPRGRKRGHSLSEYRARRTGERERKGERRIFPLSFLCKALFTIGFLSEYRLWGNFSLSLRPLGVGEREKRGMGGGNRSPDHVREKERESPWQGLAWNDTIRHACRPQDRMGKGDGPIPRRMGATDSGISPVFRGFRGARSPGIGSDGFAGPVATARREAGVGARQNPPAGQQGARDGERPTCSP